MGPAPRLFTCVFLMPFNNLQTKSILPFAEFFNISYGRAQKPEYNKRRTGGQSTSQSDRPRLMPGLGATVRRNVALRRVVPCHAVHSAF